MKRVALGEYRLQARAGKGLRTLGLDSTTGPVVGAAVVTADSDELALVGLKIGRVIEAQALPQVGRAAKGNQLVDFEQAWEGLQFVAFYRLP
jgi:DNA gyrase/topoisomerase IV subunit A